MNFTSNIQKPINVVGQNFKKNERKQNHIIVSPA